MFIQADASNIDIAPNWKRASHDAIAALAEYPVALIGDAQKRMGLLSAQIELVTPGLKLAGTVLPILAREGDNLAIHRALDDAQPGDVLVINGHGETSRAVFGDILGEICTMKGIAGVVIDGSTRDVDELTAMKLAVFARGISPAGPWKNGPGQVGFPVACGSIVCNPGDAIIGDSDGLVVIARDDVSEALRRTEKQEAVEQGMRTDIRAALTR
ncbi:methyltransferase [Rhodococcus sp. 05-2256-B2]|uniref:RraA family protein n=1 Tax=unclassified Rhodococcus (in: high G+C Gram-positive bacteria) TaxID=192944 RepID=UPI000B9BB828|nr:MULTISPECIES: RraA family protein [unclassified Rhodococcus (in: high G+C Gram-positive bacteria)]OZD80344.1 methyltransferase [Rhodococcus sp. 05-2256-B4]OZD87378.1 methyltransferase [Rhodococcus sp. 05-2256-B3]OZD94835.1 methyltransferase [Rhodococcus sp. 05-2256-B2]OZE07912.1 methyltransferase [Rhodococcus sp. 05-2256-B1]